MSAVSLSPAAAADTELFMIGSLDAPGTSLLIAAARQQGLIAAHSQARRLAAAHLHEWGAILFRGFAGMDAAAFQDFAAGFGHALLSYDFASTPRSRMAAGVYSSTEYPAHQWIPQHNEQSYTVRWPLKIWFYCSAAAPTGGETPLVDSREMYRRIDRAIRSRFAEKGLAYVRNYGAGLDLPWQTVFQTECRADVEAFCRAQEIAWEWLEDGRLRTRQLCQSEARHPVTGEIVWFNQAHLFHVSGLDARVRDSLLAVVDEEDLPRNVYYGDGTPIEVGVLDEIRGLYRELMLCFPWRDGDVLMLDNMLMAHGRAPFEGRRQILVAMAEPAGRVTDQ